jgi:hypothetical protein
VTGSAHHWVHGLLDPVRLPPLLPQPRDRAQLLPATRPRSGVLSLCASYRLAGRPHLGDGRRAGGGDAAGGEARPAACAGPHAHRRGGAGAHRADPGQVRGGVERPLRERAALGGLHHRSRRHATRSASRSRSRCACRSRRRATVCCGCERRRAPRPRKVGATRRELRPVASRAPARHGGSRRRHALFGIRSDPSSACARCSGGVGQRSGSQAGLCGLRERGDVRMTGTLARGWPSRPFRARGGLSNWVPRGVRLGSEVAWVRVPGGRPMQGKCSADVTAL